MSEELTFTYPESVVRKRAVQMTLLVGALETVLDEWDPKECNCDGAVDAPYACYFHRIEGAVRRVLATTRQDYQEDKS